MPETQIKGACFAQSFYQSFSISHDANKDSQCDGARPRCNTCIDKATPCVYSVEEGKTQQQASREELKAYRTVVCMLRRASPQATETILRHLRQHDDVNEAVKFIEADIVLRDSVSTSRARKVEEGNDKNQDRRFRQATR